MSPPLGTIDYSKPPPVLYACEGCGVSGVKLWRDIQMVARGVTLLCAHCGIKQAIADGSRSITAYTLIDNIGGRFDDFGFTDQIGGLLPAIPDESGETFWGYTSVPENGIAWWRSIPTYKET